jgi:hypothetical protein
VLRRSGPARVFAHVGEGGGGGGCAAAHKHAGPLSSAGAAPVQPSTRYGDTRLTSAIRPSVSVQDIRRCRGCRHFPGGLHCCQGAAAPPLCPSGSLPGGLLPHVASVNAALTMYVRGWGISLSAQHKYANYLPHTAGRYQTRRFRKATVRPATPLSLVHPVARELPWRLRLALVSCYRPAVGAPG